MAALPAGVLYGLSSESSYKENKELVFVKLTDSALKAIEDFIRNNRDKLAKPKIQFLPGNEGKISIPAATSGNGSPGEATFHFSINSNAEMEGPQGSFECVRSGGPRRLEACGPLPRRMRVQANDDSYEATKDRMARTVAAEQSKCTRVIKPNQTDIGRRVKVRTSHGLFSTGPTSLDRREPDRREPDRREPDRREPDRRELDRRELDRKEDRRDSDRVERPAPQPRPPQPQMTLSQSLPKLPSELQQQAQQRPPTNPDLTRRSIKERLIQLLALKPFKKPELYARLNSEGIKEKERSVVNKILPQIGTLKDNCYHLRRHMWNDVNEEWPFYSEEEKRMLKRRKPQNLTPPLSSDSANSLSPRASPSANKRAGAGAGDELPAKKQRISHYRRPSPPSSGYATTSSGERHASDNEDDRTNVKKDNGYTLNFTTVKDLCPSPPVKTNGYRNSPPVEQTKTNGYRNSPPVDQSKANGYRSSPPEDQPKANGYRCSPPSDQPKANGYRNSPPGDQPKTNGYRSSPPSDQPKTNGYRSSPPGDQVKANGYRSSPVDQSKANGYRNSPPEDQPKTNGYRSSPIIDQPKVNGYRSPTQEQTSITVKDITHNTEPLENTELASVPDENMTDLEEIERQYPPITSSGTRRAYKNEFAELYSEYLALYARVAQVASVFTQLEQQLKRAQPQSPHHQSIEQRIVEEYRRVRNDATYQSERRRVNYLHRKLTHIKRMVLQYDQLSVSRLRKEYTELPRNLKTDRLSTASTTQAY